MDTNTFKKKKDNEREIEQEVTKEQVNKLDNKVLSKDEEIRALKAQLSEARKVNKLKVGDIRAEVNRQGDPKLICVGLNGTGQREWIQANKLTDADIERMNDYKKGIKQQNAKKYN